MIGREQIQQAQTQGADVVGDDGSKIGTIGKVYLDDRTDQPQWLTVSTGMFGRTESFVPMAQARMDGDRVQVPYGKDMVKDAPRVDADGHITPEQEAELYRYYGLDDAQGAQQPVGDLGQDRTERTDRTDSTGGPGHDTSGPSTDDAMTRSEE